MHKNYAPHYRGANELNSITLRDLRIAHNYSVCDLTAASLVPVEIILRWENGEIIPDAREAIRLSELYGCSLQTVYSAIINTPAPSGASFKIGGIDPNDS